MGIEMFKSIKCDFSVLNSLPLGNCEGFGASFSVSLNFSSTASLSSALSSLFRR